MKKFFVLSLLFIFIVCFFHSSVAQNSRAGQRTAAQGDEAELREIVHLPPAERIEKLKAFIASHPRSSSSSIAAELIVSAHAELGAERLQAGDSNAAIEQFRIAITESPASMSDQLFNAVISQIPSNLFVAGEHGAAFDITKLIEQRVSDNPKRLLVLAGFYLNTEQADDATRVAELAVKLAPEMAAAHQALGAARHISLRLDDAASEYARAAELDPQSVRARMSLADLRRAQGKAEEALNIYRALLASDASNKQARTGLVLALFDLNKREEAEREMQAALSDEPRNFALLAGAAYWYVAHGLDARALELAQAAVQVEPRYTWAQIALARALIADQRPMEAERVLNFARQYGRFPTLDYELANALAATGLYNEAEDVLARNFKITDGQIGTLLAGRVEARGADFIELLAPERRASIFQPVAAETEANARTLKALLALHQAINPAGANATVNEAYVISAAQDFTAGNDVMRVFRQLYAANLLAKNRVALQSALDLTDAATGGVDAGLSVPFATAAVLPDYVRELRSNALATGSTTIVSNLSRAVLSNYLRGRLEDIAGWILFNQGKTSDAIVRLKRAATVLPENTAQGRSVLWHLGAAYEANGDRGEALNAYIKSYDRSEPDATRHAIIEALYRKVNGSLDGLDERIGPAPAVAVNTAPPATEQANTPSQNPAPSPTPAPASTPTTPANNEATAPSRTEAAPSPEATPQPSTIPVETQPAQSAPSNASPQPASERSPEVAPSSLIPPPAPEASPSPSPEQAAKPSTTQETNDTRQTAPTTSRQRRAQGRASQGGERCSIEVSDADATIQHNGGSIILTVTFNGLNGDPQITASTSNWSDIAVFPEPRSASDADSTLKFSITSISTKAGLYTVTFKSRCGTKTVSVTVR